MSSQPGDAEAERTTRPSDVGASVPGYVIGELIGEGSMGRVYRAHPEDDPDNEVALKIIQAEALTEMARERFRREVRVVSRLEASGVPPIYDFGALEDGRLWLAMERLHGSDMEHWWAAERTVEEVVDIVAATLPVLADAHEAGVIHRDLKPENVFVCGDGSVRLLDFGIARDMAGDGKKTATGIAVGSPLYMSPEQGAAPSTVGPATDVWSVGVMLYEAVTGSTPFDGETPHAVLIATCTEPHLPLDHAAPWVHPQLAEIVERCLVKNPSERFADASELSAALRVALAERSVRTTLRRARARGGETFSARPSGFAPPAVSSRDDETQRTVGRTASTVASTRAADAAELAASRRAGVADRDEVLHSAWEDRRQPRRFVAVALAFLALGVAGGLFVFADESSPLPAAPSRTSEVGTPAPAREEVVEAPAPTPVVPEPAPTVAREAAPEQVADTPAPARVARPTRAPRPRALVAPPRAPEAPRNEDELDPPPADEAQVEAPADAPSETSVAAESTPTPTMNTDERPPAAPPAAESAPPPAAATTPPRRAVVRRRVRRPTMRTQPTTPRPSEFVTF